MPGGSALADFQGFGTDAEAIRNLVGRVGADMWDACALQDKVRSSLVSATAISSLIGSAMFGLGANLPLAAAPGMGLNAYFAYNVVGYRGSGNVSRPILLWPREGVAPLIAARQVTFMISCLSRPMFCSCRQARCIEGKQWHDHCLRFPAMEAASRLTSCRTANFAYKVCMLPLLKPVWNGR